MPYEALKRAIDAAGGQAALARAVGVSQPSVWHWVHKSRRVAAEYVIAVEASTGVPRQLLRPDLYPPDALTAAHCTLCNETRAAGEIAACTAIDCPLREREAA